MIHQMQVPRQTWLARLLLLFLCLSWGASGCVDERIGYGTVQCGDTVCLNGDICDSEHGICVDPEQLTLCEGQPDGVPCAFGDDPHYRCDQGVCILGECGDGVVDSWEICDGNCTSDCDDGDVCTADMLTGSAATCDAQCSFSPITSCAGGDGCCPSGCDSATDRDCSCAVAPAWDIQTIDTITEISGYFTSSLAVDAAGHTHMSYGNLHGGDLKYGYYDGITWQIHTVGEYNGSRSSLALDAAGRAHISFYNQNLRYAYYDGISWVSQVADPTPGVGTHSSLALDDAGQLHISYAGDWTLKYAHHDSSAWQVQTVDSLSEGGTGSFSSIALDAADRPHISYIQWSGGELRYAYHDGSTWQVRTVDNSSHMDSSTSLVLDVNDRPHISYHDQTNGYLKYARRDGTTWVLEAVDTSPWVGGHSSLVLDAGGRPHISYTDYDNRDLKYAYHDGTAWVLQAVDTDGEVGSFTSLALDPAGWPQISYAHLAGTLKYARLHCP